MKGAAYVFIIQNALHGNRGLKKRGGIYKIHTEETDHTEREDGVNKRHYVNGIRIIPTEDEEQTWLFSWAEINMSRFPELELMYHVPNGGKRSKSEAARFKRMGVKAGVPDIFLPVARGGYHGLYIELKALDGRPSAEQMKFISAVTAQGYYAVVAYGGVKASEIIAAYLQGSAHNVL